MVTEWLLAILIAIPMQVGNPKIIYIPSNQTFTTQEACEEYVSGGVILQEYPELGQVPEEFSKAAVCLDVKLEDF